MTDDRPTRKLLGAGKRDILTDKPDVECPANPDPSPSSIDDLYTSSTEPVPAGRFWMTRDDRAWIMHNVAPYGTQVPNYSVSWDADPCCDDGRLPKMSIPSEGLLAHTIDLAQFTSLMVQMYKDQSMEVSAEQALIRLEFLEHLRHDIIVHGLVTKSEFAYGPREDEIHHVDYVSMTKGRFQLGRKAVSRAERDLVEVVHGKSNVDDVLQMYTWLLGCSDMLFAEEPLSSAYGVVVCRDGIAVDASKYQRGKIRTILVTPQ